MTGGFVVTLSIIHSQVSLTEGRVISYCKEQACQALAKHLRSSASPPSAAHFTFPPKITAQKPPVTRLPFQHPLQIIFPSAGIHPEQTDDLCFFAPARFSAVSQSLHPQLPLFNVSLALSFLSLTLLESALHRRCSIIPQQPKSHQRLQLDIGLPSTTYSSCTKD